MVEKKVVDYFFVAGLPEKIIDKEPLDRSIHPKLPIIDLVLINKSQGETTPPGYECLEFTTTKHPANLNHGSLLGQEFYICFKRGRYTPPIVDIGVIYQSQNVQPKPDCEIITRTFYGRSANVSNVSGEKIYLNYCRAEDFVEWDTLAVSDVCIVLPGKGEAVPYAFRKIEKNLNIGMLGSDVFLCYRKSFIKNKCLTYDAELLFRYPIEDHATFSLPTQLPMFCLPMGATVERWCANSRHPLPVFSTFVLTDQIGQKCYGASVVFYKDFDVDFLSKEQEEFFNEDLSASSNGKNGSSHATAAVAEEKYVYQQNQSICLISKWPFFNAFKKFLLYLYRVSVSGPQAIPIERYISQFFNEIPFPSPERPYISIQLTNEEIVLVQPDEIPLPRSGASFSKFLLNLGPDICLSILVCVLLEHKIVVHSIRPDLLTCVAETVAMIIFPFVWQCPYVPLCPLQLSEIVYSPTPFIIGLDSCYFDAPDPLPPTDITYVDLDAQSIILSTERSGDTVKLLPKKAAKALRNSLEDLYDGLVNDPSCPGTPGELDCHGSFSTRDALNQQKQRKTDVQIQECFLRFMAYLLRGYRSFLLPVSETSMNGEFDLSKLFDVQGFLKSHDKSYQKFLSEMLRTQYFCHFLEGRSLGSKGDAGLSFFDDCLQKLSLNSDETLVEVEEKLLSERTVVISLNDNLKEIPGVTYNYNGFTHLKYDLFTSAMHNVKSSRDAGVVVSSLPTRDLHGGPSVGLRRNKQETKSSQSTIAGLKDNPESVARCFLWSCYSVWFMLLPSQIEKSPAKNLLMTLASRAMMDLLSNGGIILDEIPLRIFFQLCGIYDKPQMAIKVFREMRKRNITLNVTTYGYYNSAVFDKKMKQEVKGFRLWKKLSIVLCGIQRFKSMKRINASKSERKGESGFAENFGSSDRNQFMRMSLRNSLFRKNKSKNYNTDPNNKKGSRSIFSPGETLKQFLRGDTLRFDARPNSLREADDKSCSFDELKAADEEGSSSNGSDFGLSRRNNSLASTPLPPASSSSSSSFAFKNESIASFLKSVQNKLSSPSRGSLKQSGRLDFDPTKSCPAADACVSSASENFQAPDAPAAASDADLCSISSSVSSIPLHKKFRDDFFACRYPHLSVDMSSQMKCGNCSSLLYDEQIMSSWNISDSDLNTKCYCCSASFVPMLHINIKEHAYPSQGMHEFDENSLSEFEVQYLNPLVARKELENMLVQKGEDYLNEADLIGEHAIIYWNLLWHVSRLGLPTDLKKMPLKLKRSKLIGQVVVRNLWDSPHTYREFGSPMYVLWKEIDATDLPRYDDDGMNKSLLQKIISGVVSSRIPVDLVLQERSRNSSRKALLLYRDIFHDVLFLSITALDRKNFDIDNFEEQYELACEILPIREKRKLMAADKTPAEGVTWYRKVFRQLHLY